MVQGHCMRCKTKREMKDANLSPTPRGTYMAKGICSSCGTKMSVIMSKEVAEKAISKGETKKA